MARLARYPLLFLLFGKILAFWDNDNAKNEVENEQAGFYEEHDSTNIPKVHSIAEKPS